MNKRILASIVSLSAVCAVGVGLVCVSPWKSSTSGENAQKERLPIRSKAELLSQTTIS